MADAEMKLTAMSQNWPNKLYLSESNLSRIKEVALSEGVSEEFWDRWVEDCIELIPPANAEW